MPGYASWKQLYNEEIKQLTEEGYDTEGAMRPNGAEEPLPFPGNSSASCSGDEAYWENAYRRLWAIRDKGLRSDYPYDEPEALDDILRKAASVPQLTPLPWDEYVTRIQGALYGRVSGVVLGKPLEMGMDRKAIKTYLESVDGYPLDDFVPAHSEKLNMSLREDCLPSTKGHVRYVQSDDDIHYTLLALRLIEKYGFAFTPAQVGENWLDNIPYHWFWCASRQAYYHMVNRNTEETLEDQTARIPTSLNPWRECIDGQIRCDLWGYLSPANPIAASELAYRDCSFSLVKNGCYGGMFVAGCLAGALSQKPDVEKILRSGLSVIPVGSRLAEAVRFVWDQYGKEQNFITTCDAIYGRYGHLPFAATINNLSIVVLALLHGNLDYSKTITTAVMCGLDTDCNGGTAGSICGAAVGMVGIDEKWVLPYHDTIKSVVAEIGEVSIADVCSRVLAQRQRKMSIH